MFANHQLILKDNTSSTELRIMYANLCQPWPTILRCVNEIKYGNNYNKTLYMQKKNPK